MTDDLSNEAFELIDEMYNEVKKTTNDPDILKVLMKGANALNRGMSAPVAAAKTINGITMFIMIRKPYFGEIFSKDYNKLMLIARSEGYKWSPTAIGDLRNQFE